MQNLSSSQSKKNQNVIFLDAKIFQNLHFENFLVQNLTPCIFFQFKVWRVVKILIQNLTRFKIFSPKSDFYLVFQVLTDRW